MTHKEIKYYRVYKCKWGDFKIEKSVYFMDEGSYKILRPVNFNPINRKFDNIWYEDYPYKWHEFHFLDLCLRKLLKRIFHKGNMPTENEIILMAKQIRIAKWSIFWGIITIISMFYLAFCKK